MPVVYLGLGTNLGDRQQNLERALALIDVTPGMRITRVSTFHATAPFGVEDQPEFLNAVVEATTDLDPLALLAAVKTIERAMGRVPTYRWGPRLIDIDILLYDRLRWESPELTIPHPGILERPFVTEPLAELAPERLEELRRDAVVPV